MRAPGIYRNRGRLAGACRCNQNVSQPSSVTMFETERLAEYPSLMPTARVRQAQAIVLNLTDIENNIIAIWQTHSYTVAQTYWRTSAQSSSARDDPVCQRTCSICGAEKSFSMAYCVSREIRRCVP